MYTRAQLEFDTALIPTMCLVCRAYRTIVEDDLKFPLIYGEGKKVKGKRLY